MAREPSPTAGRSVAIDAGCPRARGPRSPATTAPWRDNGAVDRAIGRRRSLALTSLAHFTNDGTVFFVPVIAAIVASHHGVSAGVVTLLFLVFYTSSTVLSLFVGRLSDHIGRPASLMGLGLGILSLGLLGFYFALAQTTGTALVVALLLAAFLTGSGSSFYHPLGASVLQTTFRDRSMGMALGVNGAMGSLGRALYPSLYFVAAAVIAGYGSIVLFALVGFAAGLAIWLGVRVPTAERAPRDRTGVGGPASADDPTPGGGAASAGATASAGGAASTGVPRPGSRSDTLTRGILILTAVAFLRSSATQGIASWIPTYLATQKGLGASGSLGLAVTIMYASAIIGQPVFGLLVDRFDKRAVLALSSSGAAVTTVGYLWLGSGWIGEAWLFAFGFFVFSGFPLLLSMVGDYVPRGESSLANALVWGIGSTAGGAVGPLVAGALTGGDYKRLGFAFTVLAGAALVSAAATVLVPRANRASRMRAFA
jgi:FSR family fosmidomycin resistance protein-like MFS transporter